MICVAAFIILAICVLSVPVLKIFNKPLADKIWSMFKSAWGCVGRKVTFRKCDSNFKDQVKNGLLKKIVLKHPAWVKPVSVAVETGAIIIVIITIWSLVVSAHAATMLVAYGTCDVETPESCVVGDAEACYAAAAPESTNPIEWTINWFVVWGEALATIPSKFVDWQASDFLPTNATFYNEFDANKLTALDIFDPGCTWCRQSFINQKNADFLAENNVTFIAYALHDGEKYHYANSDLIVRYLETVRMLPLENTHPSADWQIIERLFTENSPRKIVWQEDFNNYYSDEQAREILNEWLLDFGYNDAQLAEILELVDSEAVRDQINANRDIVENRVRIVKIPTMIFNGQRHEGVWK